MRTVLRVAAAAAVLFALFALVLWLTFPTDHLVRQALRSAPLPEGGAVTFAAAHLRPWGLVLDDAAVRGPDGSALLEMDWLRLRPTWTALAADRLGRPWHVAAGVFGGEVNATIDAGRTGQTTLDATVDASWHDVDVASLLAALERHDPLTGTATGTARLRLPVSNPITGTGDGDVTLRGASWRPPLPGLGDVPVHADAATARWRLRDGRLEVTHAETRGGELDATAAGHVTLAEPLEKSGVDLAVTITPKPGAPPALARLLDELPRQADGTRRFRLTGTLHAPRIIPP